MRDDEEEELAAEAMEADTVKVGAGVVEVSDGTVEITLPAVAEGVGYDVTEGRLSLGGKNFNYTDADGSASNGWANPQLAYVPILVELGELGLVEADVTGVTYDGESGSVIVIGGYLYVNIPVAENSAETASSATLDNWSLLDSASTTVVIETADKDFTFTAVTAVGVPV